MEYNQKSSLPTQANWNLNELLPNIYKRLLFCKRRYVAIKGSRGSGKSKFVSFKVIFDIMNYPYVNWLVVRRYSNTNKDSTYADIMEWTKILGVEHLFHFIGNKPEIIYKPTGQKIMFRGGDDNQNKAVSLASISPVPTRVWIEEASQIENMDTFDIVDESIRGKINYDGGFYQTIITFNPWSKDHWIYNRFFNKRTRVDNTISVTTTYKDNPFLDDAFIHKMENMLITNPRRARTAVLGEWGIAEGLVYENVEYRRLSQEDVKGLPVVAGLDFGYNDPTVAVVCYIDKKHDTVYVVNGFYKRNLHNKDIAIELNKIGMRNNIIYADSAEPKSIDTLRTDYGFKNIRPARKGKDSINFGIQLLQSMKIVVDPSRTAYDKSMVEKRGKSWMQEEFTNYVYGKGIDGKPTNKPVDNYNHSMDALRYAVTMYYAVSRNGGVMTLAEQSKMLDNMGLIDSSAI